jgi:signal transduction histidine kinase
MAAVNAYNTYLVLYSYIKYKNKDAFILLLVYAIIPLVIIARSLIYIGNIPTNVIAQHGGIIVLTFHSIVIGSFMIYKSVQIFNDKQSTILKLSEDKRMAAVSMLENLNNERERISMDIHDSLGSLLSGVSLNLQSLKEKYPAIEPTASFNNSIQYISKLDEEMRNISHNLLPNTLKEFGLIHAINKLIENEKHSKIQYSFEYQGFEERLPQNIELEIYRMILEMIDNIKKHAHAKNVLIQLNKYKDELNLILEDDGVGYRPKKIRDGANGLKNLHNRIKLLNGDIDIYTRIGEGTSISMNIPTLRI